MLETLIFTLNFSCTAFCNSCCFSNESFASFTELCQLEIRLFNRKTFIILYNNATMHITQSCGTKLHCDMYYFEYIPHKLKYIGYTYTKILPPYLQEHRGFLLVKVSVHTFPFLAGLVCTRLAISKD